METYNLYNHKNIIDFGAGTKFRKIIATANKKIIVTGDILKYNDKLKIKNLFYKNKLKVLIYQIKK